MKPLWLIASIVIICLASTSGAEAAQFEERAAFAAGGDLEISNVSGSVEIRGWDRDEIEVSADMDSDDDYPEFEVRDDTAFVGVRSERDGRRSNHRHRGQNKDVDFVVRVPRATRIAVNTVSADIEVRGLTRDQRLESVSGDVDIELRSDEASVRTVSGDIDIAGDDSVKRLKINTVSGDVELREVGGELRIESVSGDFDVNAGRFRRLLGKTVNGDLDFRGELEKGGEIDFGAINGDIDIELSSLYDTEFVLESFNGGIDEIFGYEASRKSRYAPGRILRLTEGDGASRIRIETLNGDIAIRATGEQRRKPRVRHNPGRYDETSGTDHEALHMGRQDGHDNAWHEDFDAAMEALDRDSDRDPEARDN